MTDTRQTLTHHTIACVTGMSLTVATASLTVTAAGLSEVVRDAFDFGFAGAYGSSGQAAEIALHNARITGGMLLCAAATPSLSRTPRQVIGWLSIVLLGLNAALIGIALGAYGTRLLPWLWHMPLELTALAGAVATQRTACDPGLARRDLLTVALCCWLLLAAAAVLETHPPTGDRS